VVDAMINSFKGVDECPVQETDEIVIFILPPDKIVPL
jgi:hypothetical protein